MRGVYIGNEHTHKVRVCALPLHTRAFTTHRHHECVRGVIRICICIAHTRTMYVCVLFLPNVAETIIHHTTREAESTNFRQTPDSISDYQLCRVENAESVSLTKRESSGTDG